MECTQNRNLINHKPSLSHKFTKITSTLLNPLDLISLLNKLEVQLVSHSRLVLPGWNGKNFWYMYKFMKLGSFMMSNTLYIVLHIPFIDKSLQFHLFRIHNIPSMITFGLFQLCKTIRSNTVIHITPFLI